MYHSILGLRVIKEKRRWALEATTKTRGKVVFKFAALGAAITAFDQSPAVDVIAVRIKYYLGLGT